MAVRTGKQGVLCAEHREKRERIQLYGVVPGSLPFTAERRFLQPPAEQTDVVHVIRGVIEAETAAIEQYHRITEQTDELDWVTQDMVIEILHDEEAHPRLVRGLSARIRGGGAGLSSRRTRPPTGSVLLQAPGAALRHAARRR